MKFVDTKRNRFPDDKCVVKTVNIIRNYLPDDKCELLNAWVRGNIAQGNINNGIETDYKNGFRKTPLRYSTRLSENYEYPQLVREIHKQIETEFNLTKWAEPKHSHGKDGVVVSATMPDGDVYAHIDPVDDQRPKHTLRCNILTSETKGGLIWVGNKSYELKKGDMMQYLVSKYQHSVEKVIGQDGDLRVMWMFGWYVDGNEWEASIQ
jgi:hypothetical protein